jgi:hypothetical protein
MQSLSQTLRRSVAKNPHINAAALVGVLLYIVGQALDTEIMSGYVKHNVLFLSLTDHAKKIQLFHKKRAIMDGLHSALQAQ